MISLFKKKVKTKSKVVCTCGCEEFYHGPCGGVAQNVKCKNCGKKFNVIMGHLEEI